MKILKKGNYLRAYCTEPNEGGTKFSVGDHMGTVSMLTERFSGATACMVELTREYYKLKNKGK